MEARVRDALYPSVGLVRHLVADGKGRCHHALSEGREARASLHNVQLSSSLCSCARPQPSVALEALRFARDTGTAIVAFR